MQFSELILILTPISLIDSTSVIPFALVVLSVLLGGRRPYLSSTMFLLGLVAACFPAGVLLVVGLGSIFDKVGEYLIWKLNNPGTLFLALQIVVGVVMIVFGYRMAVARRERAQRKEPEAGMSPPRAFLLGAGAMLAGLWGALPYFAAVDQILRADLPLTGVLGALLYYNLVFIAPLAALVVLRAVVGERANSVFAAINRFFEVWGRRVLMLLLLALGIALVADGIGFLMGHPLLPYPISF